jgi:hypothetical protein
MILELGEVGEPAVSELELLGRELERAAGDRALQRRYAASPVSRRGTASRGANSPA